MPESETEIAGWSGSLLSILRKAPTEPSSEGVKLISIVSDAPGSSVADVGHGTKNG